ncbi:MAG: mechanosensitive ion channel domain-containing protein [Crocinitomicaceae bacterium]
MQETIENILYYPLIHLEDFSLAPINLLLFALLFVAGKIIIKFTKRLFKHQDLTDKRFTVEGKEFPLWKLVKQLIWLIIVFVGLWSLNINNPNLKSSELLVYEFIRFNHFHIAVYHIFIIVFIIFFSRILMSLIRIYFVQRIKSRGIVDEGSLYVYLQLTKYLIVMLSIIFMLRSMGVDLGLFITSMAFLLVAIGLGLQGVFRDFFSGFLILFENTIKVKDIIEIDQPNEENIIGRIIDINLRTSKIETRDGKILIVPNSQLTHLTVNNWTTGNHATRFTVAVAVSYDSDLEVVKQILTECAREHHKSLKNRDIRVRLLNFGDNGYELDVVFWANHTFSIEMHKSEIRFAIDQAFRKQGVTYPYPQMDIHFDRGFNPSIHPENKESPQ